MLDSLSKRDRVALGIGVALVSTLLVGFRGVPRWTAWNESTRLSATELETQLSRDSVQIRTLPQVLDILDMRIRRLRSAGPALLIGSNPSEGASALARVVTEAAKVGMVRILTVDVQVDTAAQTQLLPVVVNVTANGDIAGLASMLEIIEAGPSLLTIDRLSVESHDVYAPDEVPEDLSIRVQVSGLILPKNRLDLRPASGPGAES